MTNRYTPKGTIVLNVCDCLLCAIKLHMVDGVLANV